MDGKNKAMASFITFLRLWLLPHAVPCTCRGKIKPLRGPSASTIYRCQNCGLELAEDNFFRKLKG
jgi:hypothetical protein